MTPQEVPLPDIWKNTTYLPVTFTWKDPSGAPFDLTGWVPVVRSRNVNFNPVVTDPTNGVVTLSLNVAQTSILKLGEEKWYWVWHNGATTYPPSLFGTVQVKDVPFVANIPA